MSDPEDEREELSMLRRYKHSPDFFRGRQEGGALRRDWGSSRDMHVTMHITHNK
jgi:hypothetical protein